MGKIKVGDIVKYKEPYPDENPNQRYVVLELFHNGIHAKADIAPVDWKGSFRPIYSRTIKEITNKL